MLSSGALDYLDEIIATDEKAVAAQESDVPKPESTKRNNQPEPPKEKEKYQIFNEDDVTEAPDYEDNLTRFYSTNASANQK